MRRSAPARAFTGLSPFLLSFLVLSTPGCPEPDHRVPYRANEGTTGTATTPTTAPQGGATTPFTPVPSVAVPPGSTTVTIDGARITYGDEIEIVATLATDVDHDGDRDALVLLASPIEQAIGFARRDGAAFTPSILTRTMLRPDCTRVAFEARTISADLAAVTRVTTCGTREEREVLPIALGATPTVVDGLRVLPIDADTPWVEKVRLEPGAEDVDGDGTIDFVVTTYVTPRGLPETSTKLVWPNLPSGLALERGEPSRTLTTMTRDARGKLGRSPSKAAEKSGQALALVAALCRENGAAVVATPSARGIPCGDLPTLGRILAIRVAALVAKDSLPDAHETLRTAVTLGIRIDDANVKLVTDAIAAVPNVPTLAWRVLSDVAPSARPDEENTTLSFEDDATIVARGATPVRIRLGESITSEPAADVAAPMTSPSSSLALLDVRTNCRGDVASFTSSTGPWSASLSRVAPFDPALPCEAGSMRDGERGRFTPLGLTAEGLVLALGREVLFAPIDANGRTSGVVTPRAAGSLGEVRGGAVTRDGRNYVLNLDHAAVLRESSGRFLLLRNGPFETADGPIRALALAPSGRAIAVLRGRTLWLGTL